MLAHLVLLAFSLPVFLRVIRKPPAPKTKKPMHIDYQSAVRPVFHFVWPQTVYAVLYWSQTQSYRFILADTAGLAIIGLFTVGFSIGMMPVLMFDQWFKEFYDPIFYQAIADRSKQEQAKAWNQLASAYFPALILIVIFVVLAGPFLATFLVGERFRWVGWLSLWGGLATCGAQASSTIGMAGRAVMNTRILIWPNLVGALVAVGGVVILSGRWPLGGTGLSLTLGTVISAVLIILQVRRLLPVQLPWRRIGFAILICLPLVVAMAAIRAKWPSPNIMVSLITLVVSGSYMFGGQFILARPWLRTYLGSSL